MIRRLLGCMVVVVLVACNEDPAPTAGEYTSPGGTAFRLITLPGHEDIAMRVAWPTDWAYRADTNPAASYVGADLILAGGATGFPAGEVVETFADLDAEGNLSVSSDHLVGRLVFSKEDTDAVIEIANAHLRAPLMDDFWFDRIKSGFADNLNELQAQPTPASFNAIRYAVLGDQPLRAALSLDDPAIFTDMTVADVRTWHAEVLTNNPEAVVIAGDIDTEAAGALVDQLFAGLPPPQREIDRPATASFNGKRILLHMPDTETTHLSFLGPLPPSDAGKRFEDFIINTALSGGADSVLFDAVRTQLRATYNYESGLDGYSSEFRVFYMTGQIEGGKLAAAETVIRDAYESFRASGPDGDLEERKAGIRNELSDLSDYIADQADEELFAQLTGGEVGRSLRLMAVLDAVTSDTIKARLSNAFPAADDLIMVAVSPNANALPGACVITSPAEAASCP